MERFHDEDFQGVCIKLEDGFIKMNPEVENALNVLKSALEHSNSVYLPSRVKSLHELEFWKDKSDIIRKQKKDQEERFDREKKAAAEKRCKRLSGEFIEIHEDTVPLAIYHDNGYLTIEGNSVELFTKRSYIRAEATATFDEWLRRASKEDFLQFLKNNMIATPSFCIFDEFKRAKLSVDQHGCPVIRIPFPFIAIYYEGKRKKENLYYRLSMLMYTEELGYFAGIDTNGPEAVSMKVPNSGTTMGVAQLGDYQRIGHKFVKK